MADELLPGSGSTSPGIDREQAQRRLEELIAKQGTEGKGGERNRRTRAILMIVLVVLLLLLCGVGVFMYRLLAPAPNAGDNASSDTNGITWIRSIYGFGPNPEQLFTNPNDAVTAPDGTVWVADPGGSRVLGFRGDGTYVGIVQGDQTTGEPFRIPSRIAIDPDGLLYIVDRANETLTIMDGDTQLASSKIPGITCVDSDNEITVVGSASGFAILDKDGNVQTIVGTRGTGDDQFDTVGGIAIDSQSKTIYVADTYNNRLSAWDYTGARKWVTQLGAPANTVKLEGGQSLDTSATTPSALQLPTDVTVDGNGRPIILDAFDFTIAAFRPSDGTFIGKWGNYGEKDGQFMYPSGFDYDPAKDWFTVADTQNLRAQIIRIPGSGATGASAVGSWLSRLLAGPARALWPCAILLPVLLLLALLGRRRRRRNQAGQQEYIKNINA